MTVIQPLALDGLVTAGRRPPPAAAAPAAPRIVTPVPLMLLPGARGRRLDRPAPLLPVLRRMLVGTEGRAALRVPLLPRLAAPGRRRIATHLLEEAAQGGGAVLHTLTGEALLLGAARAATGRVATLLGELTGATLTPWLLPRDAPALLAWGEGQVIAPAPDAAPDAGADLPGLPRLLATLPAEHVLRTAPLIDAAGAPQGRLVRLSRRAIATALGPLGADPDLLADAQDALLGRLRQTLGGWAAAAGQGVRIVPLPQGELPPPAAIPGAVLLRPLPALAQPGFAAWRAALAGLGWRLALGPIDAAALRLLKPSALPADLLLLDWSGDLLDRAPATALRQIDPARLVLGGRVDAAGRDWAAHLGIGLVVAPLPPPPGAMS